MDFSKIPFLITKDESHELYEYQGNVLKSPLLSDEEKLIRLAIIQTLAPVEDWESAAELLKGYIYSFNKFNLLIGAFIALTAFESVRYKNISFFISLINNNMPILKDESLSVACFIKARYIIEKGENLNEAIALLKQSIIEGPQFVMNYMELSRYADQELKKQYIRKACENVKSTFDNKTDISTSELIEPRNFFNERILEIDMNNEFYQKLLSQCN